MTISIADLAAAPALDQTENNISEKFRVELNAPMNPRQVTVVC
jgi:hypothetical protein